MSARRDDQPDQRAEHDADAKAEHWEDAAVKLRRADGQSTEENDRQERRESEPVRIALVPLALASSFDLLQMAYLLLERGNARVGRGEIVAIDRFVIARIEWRQAPTDHDVRSVRSARSERCKKCWSTR